MTQQLYNVSGDQEIILDHADALKFNPRNNTKEIKQLFTDISQQGLNGKTKHKENTYNDFDHELLLPQLLSTEGPRILDGDLNSDGKLDFILLGAHEDEDKIFHQTESGSFQLTNSPTLIQDKEYESTCGSILDLNRDGHNDIIIGSGGNEYGRGKKVFQLRVYINNGKGKFVKEERANEEVFGNFSTIVASDIDGDNDQDLFVGARLVPGNYGIPPKKFLLRNDNGKFTDITTENISGIGMVTDAHFSDIDQDGDEDLIVVGDWMAIQIFNNEKGKFVNAGQIDASNGRWNRISAADLDQDGDIDFVLGNQGLNSKLKADKTHPVKMHVNDFDNNGKTEFIINWYPPGDDLPYPFATKPEITSQLPLLRKQILKYDDYAKLSYNELFPTEVIKNSIEYKSNNHNSSILWNESDGMKLQALPIRAQLSPIFAIECFDFDKDGDIDIWLGGNQYGLKPQIGRQDASRGLLLRNQGRKNFEVVSSNESGFNIYGEIRDVKFIETNDKRMLLVARNNEDALLYQLNQ